MNENPYALSPDLIAGKLNANLPTDESLMSIARTVFIAWEKLRIIYIGILTTLTLLLVSFVEMFSLSLVVSILFGAFLSNLLYFAGPVIDTYIRWLGYKNSWPRWVMFVAGTLLSIVLAIGLLGSFLLPVQP